MTRTPTLPAALALVLVAALWVGCKDRPEQHPATDRAVAFLEAVQYGDFERASAMHVDATERGFYCESRAFDELTERAREAATDEECERLADLSAADLERLETEAHLLVQMVRFFCEEPEGGCEAYGERVLESHMETSEQRGETTQFSFDDFDLQKVVGDQDKAVVYVDLTGSGEEPGAAHETFEMRRHDGEWFVTEAPERESLD
ncbi:MAG: hypothetical protein ACOCV2_12100 [Persicimonas sp.]